MTGPVAVLTVRAAGSPGGAERFYHGLADALSSAGADVEIVEVVCDESSFEGILRGYENARSLDLDRFWGVVSTKAPTYAVRHPNHVCYLVHTIRVFYDMFEREFGSGSDEQRTQRDVIHHLDRRSLSFPNMKGIFAIGTEVAERTRRALGVTSKVLPIPYFGDSTENRAYRHFFLPGRLHRWKRVDLAIEAFRRVERDVGLVIAGDGEDAGVLRRLASDDDRITFAGRVDEGTLQDLYSSALAVPFLPVREDYGLVVLEAFAHEKPVVTTFDAGEPARMIAASGGGFVTAPDPAELAVRLTELVDDPSLARRLGCLGRAYERSLTWERVAAEIMYALRA
jgi:glycosyltransferase involved in cell wall biosynthesis